MSRTKKWALVCVVLIAVGVGLILAGSLMGARILSIGVNNNGLYVKTAESYPGSAQNNQVKEDITLDSFSSIESNIDFADLTIIPSDHFGLSYSLNEYFQLTYEVKDGCLYLNQKNSSEGLNLFNFSLGANFPYTTADTITIYLPEDSGLTLVSGNMGSADLSISDINVDSLDLHLSFGNIRFENMEIDSGDIHMDSGNADFSHITFNSLNLENNFGNITFTDLSVSGKTEIFLDSGTLKLEEVHFSDLHFTGSFNTMEGSKITADNLDLSLDSGNVMLRELLAESMSIESSFGNVDLELVQPLDYYNYDVTTEFGSITIGGKKLGMEYYSLFGDESSGHWINITCSSCDVTIKSDS